MVVEEIMSPENGELKQKEFYEKEFKFSYSSLSKLIWNPVAFFQHYILGIKEEKLENHLVQGKLIHCLLLEKDKVDQYFIMSPVTLPTGNSRTVIDRVFNHYLELSKSGDTRTELSDFSDAIIDVLKDMDYYQSLKTDAQRLDKVITPETSNYWEFLKKKGNKIIIDQETMKFCTDAVEIVKTNTAVCELIGLNVTEFDNKLVLNEETMEMDIRNRPFGLKGIIDNIVIDHDNKLIYVNDLKTSSKDLADFPETVEYYNYWLQAIIYCTLIVDKYQDLFDNGYKMKFHFVVIDRMFQSYAFPVSESTLNSWLDRLNTTLNQAEWHYTNKNYLLPYKFATGEVVL